jgi:hypothetical protein
VPLEFGSFAYTEGLEVVSFSALPNFIFFFFFIFFLFFFKYLNRTCTGVNI